ncbi:MAG TPA: DUF3102 domain-containing protein [Chthoniobacterales bacterium]|jgi:hypothetical protein|nr:DUF3102 domain-containing protein [Chthoniobacterales bacterium]
MSKEQLSVELQPRADPDAAEAIKLHNIAVFFGNRTLTIAVKCGELLAKKKDSLSQGQWLPWVKRNLPFTDRTARRYIKVWHNRQTFKEEERHKLTLRQFYFAITDSKSVRPGLLQADKQRMIRDCESRSVLRLRRLKHQAASLKLNYEY